LDSFSKHGIKWLQALLTVPNNESPPLRIEMKIGLLSYSDFSIMQTPSSPFGPPSPSLHKRQRLTNTEHVRTVFKDTGGMPSDTLNTPLFQTLTDVLLREFPIESFGPSLDLFAHETVRTDICNMFDPTGTSHGCAPNDDIQNLKTARCFHNPFMKERHTGPGSRDGYIDFREAIDQEFPPSATEGGRPFGVTLIDPPYTPMEQKKLYSKKNTVSFTEDVARDFMLTNHDDINELYRHSVEWAIERTKEVIVIYGYKNPTLPGWERRVVRGVATKRSWRSSTRVPCMCPQQKVRALWTRSWPL
jgi:hypothetical protein